MVRSKQKKVRYAVVGLGYISQVAMLPAFRHARKNSELVALVSSERDKLRKLGKEYGARIRCTYEEFDDLVGGGEIDAIYLATPNDMHLDFVRRAAAAGVHVLCEKPMEVTEDRCKEMIRATREGGVKLMIAYRLHFEAANLTAMQELKKGKIGEPRLFSSVFTMPVNEKSYRAGARSKGGGPLYDIGIYCLNAARYLFQCEPVEVSATAFGRNRRGKSDSELTLAAQLRFEHGQCAAFQCSFGAFSESRFEVLGTKGIVTLENAFEIVGMKNLVVQTKKGKQTRKFQARDQFGPELLYFSDCILNNRKVEPSGFEGLADIRIIRALFESADTGRAIAIEPMRRQYPTISQEIDLPKVKKPRLIDVEEPSQDEAA